MASIRPATGETIVQETRTRVEPKAAQNEDTGKPRPSMWEYIDSLTDADWATGHYKITVERGRKEAKAEERSFVCEVFAPLTPADIAKQWGGGEYTIWFKIGPKGQQLRDKITLRIDGPPIAAPPGSPDLSRHGQPQMYNDPLSRMIDLFDRRLAQMEAKLDATGIGAVNEATRQAMLLNSQVFGAALPAVGGALQKLSGGGNSESPLMEKFMAAAIDRLLSPPAAATPATSAVKDAIDMINAFKGSGLMTPDKTNPMTQLAIEGIRQLPAAIAEGVKGLEQWHLAEEARARTMAMQRGMNPQPINITPQPAAAAAAPPPPPPVNGAAAANPSPGAATTVQVNIETIEIGLVRILTNQAYTIEEAAHRSAAFMQDLVPGMPDQLAAAGEVQILQLFQTRPILMQVPQNPRLSEFIKKFIEVVKAAPIMAQTQPPAVPPA